MGIFSWLSGGTSGGGSDEEEYLEADTDTRLNAALKVAGTTDPVDAHIKDWGDHGGDYSAQQNAVSWEHTDVDTPYFDRAAIYKSKEDK